MTIEDEIVEFLRRVGPVMHEPLATEVARVWSIALSPLLNRVRAEALTQFTDEYEMIAAELERSDDATPEYWRGAADASEYFVARLRSHADFLVHGHEEPLSNEGKSDA